MDPSQLLPLPARAYASAVIRLPAELGVEAASALHRQLSAHLEDAEPVTLDAREVAHIHTAALQLFCLFCRDRRDGGRATHWQAPSNAMRAAAALLGATTLMNLAQETKLDAGGDSARNSTRGTH